MESTEQVNAPALGVSTLSKVSTSSVTSICTLSVQLPSALLTLSEYNPASSTVALGPSAFTMFPSIVSHRKSMPLGKLLDPSSSMDSTRQVRTVDGVALAAPSNSATST